MAKRPGGSVFLFFVVGLLSFSFQACKPKKIRVNSASEPQKSGNTNQSVNSFVRVSVNAGIVDSFAAQFPHNYWFNQNNIEVNHDCRDDVIAIQLAPSNNNGKELFCRVYSPSENRWEEWQDCQSLTQSRFEDLEEGVQKFQARCTSTDFAGNVIEGLSNTVQWGTDTIPPLVRPSAGNTKYVVAIENNVPVVQFESLDDLSSVNQDPQSASAWKKTYCRITGSVQTSWRDCSQPLPTLNDGDYELEIRAEDFAGNISDIQSEAFRVGRSHLPNEKGSCRLLAQPEGNLSLIHI